MTSPIDAIANLDAAIDALLNERKRLQELAEDHVPPRSLLVRDHLEWLIERATSRTRGNISEAAKLLGVDRTTLSHWVNRGLSGKYCAGASSAPAQAPLSPHVAEAQGNR